MFDHFSTLCMKKLKGFYLVCVFPFKDTDTSEVYSEPYQTSKRERFAKIVKAKRS